MIDRKEGKANPKGWPDAEMRQMMHDHLTLTTDEAAARLHGDLAGERRPGRVAHGGACK